MCVCLFVQVYASESYGILAVSCLYSCNCVFTMSVFDESIRCKVYHVYSGVYFSVFVYVFV